MTQTCSLSRPGLFRTVLAGRGGTLAHAFEKLRGSGLATGNTASPDGLFGATVKDGDAHWEMVRLRGLGYLVVTDCAYAGERTEVVPFEALFELHFTLCGQAQLSDGQESENGSDFDMIACAVGEDASYEVTLPQGRRRSVAIYVDRERLADFLDPATSAASALSRRLSEIGRGQVYVQRSRATLAQVDLLERLLRNTYGDRRRWLFAEALVTQLLCSAIDTWSADRPTGQHVVMRPRDIQLIEQARQIVLDTSAAPLTIEELARRVGTNTAKLKAGFRILFGCTVFELSLKTRLGTAMTLLQSGQHTISEVAEAAGYSHASSFATAFQRYFGYSPSDAQRLAKRAEAVDEGRRAAG